MSNSKNPPRTLCVVVWFGALPWRASLGHGAHPAEAQAAAIDKYIATAPSGFSPLSAPRQDHEGSGQGRLRLASCSRTSSGPRRTWPSAYSRRGLMEFTGASNLVESLKRFIHKDDVVAVKVNGIAGQTGHTQATNFEVILPLVEGLIGLGVPPEKIAVCEQFPSFLAGTRVNVPKLEAPGGRQGGDAQQPRPPDAGTSRCGAA